MLFGDPRASPSLRAAVLKFADLVPAAAKAAHPPARICGNNRANFKPSPSRRLPGGRHNRITAPGSRPPIVRSASEKDVTLPLAFFYRFFTTFTCGASCKSMPHLSALEYALTKKGGGVGGYGCLRSMPRLLDSQPRAPITSRKLCRMNTYPIASAKCLGIRTYKKR